MDAERVDVTHGIARADYPAVHALDHDRSVVIDGHPATFWEALSDSSNE